MSLIAFATILTVASGFTGFLESASVGAPCGGRLAVPLPIQQASALMAVDYEPIPLDRLIGTAQLIVSGSVTSVKKNTFLLQVSRSLAGKTASSRIEVVQFHPSRFEGAPRPAPYRIGQSFLLFLVKDGAKQASDRWMIIGIGGEGEMPVAGGFVYFHGRYVEGFPVGKYIVHGVERTIQRWDSAQVFDAVKKYRTCFQWTVAPDGRPKPRPICDRAALERFGRTSPIHRYLLRLTTRRLDSK